MTITSEEFWSRVRKGDDCWLWMGGLGYEKYGAVSVQGFKTTAAHRIAYMLHTGQQLLPRLPICHKCDNPQCVRPDHLHVGTASDNGRDRSRQFGPNAKVGIYKLNLPLRWGYAYGYKGEPATHTAHISSDESFAMCGHPLVYMSLFPAGGLRYGMIQKGVCTDCLNEVHAYYPNGYDFVRKVPERHP
ncbi:MAG TPA: HNH endonuclease signature motif containing protein [Chloroflexaceae bacterium]|nr:HNH endonuclease signature motif containing protein [Chloroflexaceae bacterium]